MQDVQDIFKEFQILHPAYPAHPPPILFILSFSQMTSESLFLRLSMTDPGFPTLHFCLLHSDFCLRKKTPPFQRLIKSLFCSTMSYPGQYRLGPTQTPKPLKILILTTFLASIFSALMSNLFPQVFGLASPQQLLGLSAWGIHHLFLWQFVTYFFIHPILHGISFSFLLSLGFSLYLMWVIGSSIIERQGTRAFLSLYFASGIFVGIILFLLQQASGTIIPFAGNTPILYAILMGWVMLYPEAQLLLLLALPVKAKWLILSILCANLLIDLSVGDWLGAVSYFAGAVFGYFYPLIFWGARGPFPALHPFEEKIGKIFGHDPQTKEPPFTSQRGKIYDFKTGKAILNDDEFLDEMLSKISAHGKGSLTWKERFRLRRISRRKKKEKDKE